MLPGFLIAILRLLGFIAADVPRPPAELYGGLDNLSFPGRDFLRLLRPVAPAAPNTNLHWTGLYLSHSFNGTDPSWTAQTAWLRGDGWGILPIYLGRQAGPGSHPTAAQGTADAALALAQARVAALPRGVVLYIDWESNDHVTAADIGYIRNWSLAVAADGYRPGMYAFPVVAQRLREEVPGLFVWVINVRNTAAGIDPVAPANPTFLRWHLIGPTATDDPDAVAVQYLWPWAPGNHVGKPNLPIHRWPAGPPPFRFPMPGLAGVTYGTPGAPAFSAAGVPLFDIDISGSTVGDPSFPERRVQPTLVREGRSTALAASSAATHVFAVRRGQVPYYSVTPPNIQSAALYAVSDAITFNPWAPPGAVARPTATGGVAEDLLLIGRSSAAGAADDAWQVCAYRGTPAGWTLETGIGGAAAPRPDPIAGVTAAARSATSIDAFVIGLDDGVLYNSTWTGGGAPAWAAFKAVTDSPPFLPHRACGTAAVSRTPGIMDVFAVNDTGWRLHAANSPVAGTWTAPFPIGDPLVYSHPLSRMAVAAAPAAIDVVFVGKKDTDADWLLYHTYWRQANGWLDAGGPHTQAIAGASPTPLANVAAVNRGANFVDVFYAGRSDGLLYYTWLDRGAGTWSAPVRIGGSSIRVASVDAAVVRVADELDVVVTSLRDMDWAAAHPLGQDTRGKGIYFTSRAGPAPGTFSTLARVWPLDLV